MTIYYGTFHLFILPRIPLYFVLFFITLDKHVAHAYFSWLCWLWNIHWTPINPMQFVFLQESVDIELYFSNALHFNWSINRSNKHKMKNQKIAHCPNNSKIKYQNHRKRTIWYPLTHKYMIPHLPGFNKKWRVKLCPDMWFRSSISVVLKYPLGVRCWTCDYY